MTALGKRATKKTLLLRIPPAKILVLFSFWMTFTLPAFGITYLLERFLVIILAGACLIFLMMCRNIPRTYFGRSLALVYVSLSILSVTYVATYFYFLSVKQIDTGARDLLEIARYPLFLLYLSGLIIARKSIRVSWFIKFAITPSVYFIVSCFALYVLPIPFASPIIHTIYQGTKTAINFSSGWISWSIPFENPNFMGLYLVWTLTILLFFTPRVPWFPALLSLLFIFVTGSRTAWAASLFVVFLWLVASALTAGRRRRALWVITLFCIGGLAVFSLSPLSFSEMARVQLLTAAINKGSILLEPNLAFRVEQIKTLASAALAESPILGFGPSKYGIVDIIDNQYLLWLVRTGLLGAMLMILSLSILVFTRPLTYYQRHRDSFKVIGVLAFVGATGLALLTGAFLDNIRLLFLFLSVVLLVVGNPQEAEVRREAR